MASTTVMRRRKKLTAHIDQCIKAIAAFCQGKPVAGKPFWSDRNGTIHLQLRYGKHPLVMSDGESLISSPDFEDLVEQLDQLKIITIAGGLDDALAAVGKSGPTPLP